MRRAIPAISISLALAVAAVLLIDARSGDSESGAAAGVQSTATAIDGAEDASAHNSPGAEAAAARNAAVAAVAMTDEVVRAGFISRRDLIRSFTTDTFGEQLADETSEQVADLLLELGQREVPSAALALVEQPMAARVTSFDGHAASVDVWSVLAIAAEGAGPARQVWRTVAVELQDVDGEWLVDGWQSRLGPTPMLAPEVEISSATDVAAAISWTEQELG